MPNLIKLNIKKMEQLNYHWFWGLQYQKSPEPTNLATNVKTLLQNDEALKSLQGKMRALYQSNGIIPLIWRLFNINNYTYHSYLLAACKLHENFLNSSAEHRSDMNEERNLSWVGLTVGWAFAMAKIIYLLKRTKKNERPLLANSPHENEACRTLVEQKNIPELLPNATKNDRDIFRVTDQMNPHLVVLGLELNSGDVLNIPKFKTACKKLYFTSHPDKGGSVEQFRKIRDAAECVTQLMSNRDIASKRPSYNRNHTNSWDSFSAELDEIIATYAAYNAESKADISELKDSFAKNEAALTKNEAGIKEIQAMLDNLNQDAANSQGNAIPSGVGLFAASAASPPRVLPSEEKALENQSISAIIFNNCLIR